MGCCINELRDKEVVNICDGRRLGYICDVEIDLCAGRLEAIILPGESRLFGLSRGEDIRIPWECIERIGDDIVLVNAKGLSCECNPCADNRRHRFFG